jgi:hypothetical protein
LGLQSGGGQKKSTKRRISVKMLSRILALGSPRY